MLNNDQGFKKLPYLSVVVPCYNEAKGLREFHRRMQATCRDMKISEFEMIYVDDGSVDETWAMISEFTRADPWIKGIKLSRNFGHSGALTAGLDHATGQYILIIDADLQDPPELLEDMFRAINRGADIAYGHRIRRHGESVFKTSVRLCFLSFYQYIV
jgi:glycosyltransferase involved in cell wall biosynthesis